MGKPTAVISHFHVTLDSTKPQIQQQPRTLGDRLARETGAAFPHGGEKYGFDLNVRWSGTPRRYTDLYYDNSTNDLFGALHALRHRQGAGTSSSISITDSFATLESTTFGTLNWQKVQY